MEFDQTMREMKQQKAEALRPLQVMINGIKEEQAAKRRVVHELAEQLSKLEQERQQISRRLDDIAADWNKRISDFFHENFTESRELGEVSDWALIKELNKRGFYGGLLNPDRTDNTIDTINAKLNTGHTPEDMLKAISDRLGDIKVTKETPAKLPKSGIIIDGELYEGVEQDIYDSDKICPECAMKNYCDKYLKRGDRYGFCNMHSETNFVQYKKVEK